MNEDFFKKQNEEKMLELQCYARFSYNTAENCFFISILLLIVNTLLGMVCNTNIFLAILYIISNTIWWLSEFATIYFIKSAANAREVFDCELYGFELPENHTKMYEIAHKMHLFLKKFFQIQMNNTGIDNPPGVKDWYSKCDGNKKNEIIFKCQKENIYWDTAIMLIDKIILLSILIILIIIYTFIKRDNNILDYLLGLLPLFEIISKIVQIIFSFKKHKENIEIEKHVIDRIEKKENVIDDDLMELQSLIRVRRNLNLLPFNSIHKIISQKMHRMFEKS